jgi:hypothetical protein
LGIGVLVPAILFGAVIICGSLAWAEDADKSESKKGKSILEQPGRLFDMEIPKGFKQVTSDEPGIQKWKKGTGEIHLVVGQIQLDSGDRLYKALAKAVKANSMLEEVRVVELKGGHALAFREKAPGDPGRLRSMRLFVITNKKVFTVDFVAPSKDFDSFSKDFEQSLKSFKLNVTGS